ncbi:MAG: hypothetical protein LBT86_07710 [Deltaproteobacteria bacterium]|nr:hypothetical protein [Deltaproteobacteria bacterium]
MMGAKLTIYLVLALLLWPPSLLSAHLGLACCAHFSEPSISMAEPLTSPPTASVAHQEKTSRVNHAKLPGHANYMSHHNRHVAHNLPAQPINAPDQTHLPQLPTDNSEASCGLVVCPGFQAASLLIALGVEVPNPAFLSWRPLEPKLPLTPDLDGLFRPPRLA